MREVYKQGKSIASLANTNAGKRAHWSSKNNNPKARDQRDRKYTNPNHRKSNKNHAPRTARDLIHNAGMADAGDMDGNGYAAVPPALAMHLDLVQRGSGSSVFTSVMDLCSGLFYSAHSICAHSDTRAFDIYNVFATTTPVSAPSNLNCNDVINLSASEAAQVAAMVSSGVFTDAVDTAAEQVLTDLSISTVLLMATMLSHGAGVEVMQGSCDVLDLAHATETVSLVPDSDSDSSVEDLDRRYDDESDFEVVCEQRDEYGVLVEDDDGWAHV
ncbi:hypothetical protein BJ741DRAFT_595943 [Chytriomyces cf. hyalinus JEL632]|nr:hypothetical protein BJ741DRAFT_595943 [Chytriomyces cf. hyalinus JEL632]